MKKAGFTLAEVLITLMILGIIAALTVPSLIQNTQKKEEVVQLKKGLSMINQAVTMNYALDQEDLTQAGTANGEFGLLTVLNERLAVTKSDLKAGGYVVTQDGLTYYVDTAAPSGGCSSNSPVEADGSNACYKVIISVRPDAANSTTGYTTYSTAEAKTPEQSKASGTTGTALTGYYQFYAGADRVVASTKTAEILYAKNATTVSGSGS